MFWLYWYCFCPLVWGLNVSLSLFLGRYGKAWQSPDITLLLMLDIFTSSQSGESNPSSTQRFFGDWCEQKRLKMGWNQRDNGEEPNRTLLCFFLQEGGAAKDTRVNFTLKKTEPKSMRPSFFCFLFPQGPTLLQKYNYISSKYFENTAIYRNSSNLKQSLGCLWILSRMNNEAVECTVYRLVSKNITH